MIETYFVVTNGFTSEPQVIFFDEESAIMWSSHNFYIDIFDKNGFKVRTLKNENGTIITV